MNMPRHISMKPSHVAALDIALPCSAIRSWRIRASSPGDRRASARFSARMRIASTAALRTVKTMASSGRSSAQWQHGDLAGHHRIVGVRQKSIGSRRHQRLARQHDDPRRPSRAERPQHPATKALQRDIHSERHSCSRVDVVRIATAIAARPRAPRRSMDSAASATSTAPRAISLRVLWRETTSSPMRCSVTTTSRSSAPVKRRAAA